MAKVLISSIGTGIKKDGGYRLAKYEYNGKIKETPFISKALCEFLDIDKLYLVGTKGSIWDSVYREFGGEDENIELYLYEKQEENALDEKDLEIVNNQINKFLGSKDSKCFLINYGINEEELWQNFEIYLKILDYIKKDDEVFIDISHSFRSLAFLSFIMLQFGKTIRNDFKIKGVFYGMLEYSSQNNGITPVVDLKVFFEFLEWAKAFEELDKFASLNTLVNLSNGIIPNNAYNILQRMEEAFNIANMSTIHKEIQRLKNHMKYFEESKNKIIKLLSPKLKEFINILDKKSLGDFQFALAEFFAKRNNSAMGYTALAEAIITKIGEKQGLSEEELTKKEKRDEIKKLIREGFDKNYPYSHPRKKFAHLFTKINNTRNNICHQLENTRHAKHDIENLLDYIKKSKQYIKELF